MVLKPDDTWLYRASTKIINLKREDMSYPARIKPPGFRKNPTLKIEHIYPNDQKVFFIERLTTLLEQFQESLDVDVFFHHGDR